ncbi:hypothetical protein JY572_20560 [Myxococcus landrumensis]|uniref:Pilus assembly protein n=1 Tax=Myxococcus landrumensis TaxID=2813577 RepID=A0ABX7MWR7_9BACT|nr:hypothetical protein JY572_20560 [Myxococcus landrumus]
MSPTPRRRGARAARGAAAVETALCMLVIIPVFMYAIFLDDLLRHSLDAQETAVSTIWDYTTADYAAKPDGESFAGFGQIQGLARQTYCDHESGLDSFQTVPPECDNDQSHHQELVAHACWLHPGAQQVQCTLNQQAVGSYGVTLHAAYMSRFNRGGLIRCSARNGVQNYLLPKTLFSEFSQVDLAKETKSGSIHHNATANRDVEKDTYLLPWERIALVTDTWALTREQSFEPGQSNNDEERVYARVSQLYTNNDNGGYSRMKEAAEALVSAAIGDKLLSDDMELDKQGPGDDPRKLSMSIKPQNGAPTQDIKQGGDNSTYFNNEWQDWDQDNNKATYEARAQYYMGCSKPGCKK